MIYTSLNKLSVMYTLHLSSVACLVTQKDCSPIRLLPVELQDSKAEELLC